MDSKDTPSAPSSPPSTFPLFGSLPYELRREIYFLATPPRVVHVREDYDFPDDDERDRFRWERGHHPYPSCPYLFHYPSWTGVSYRWLFLFQQFQREFEETTFPLPITLHPDLAYFAHNWRDRLAAARLSHQRRTGLRQTLLSEWWPGFASSSSSSKSPWPETPETPAIPLHWLAEQPEIAFELLRRTFLYSEAPIPALLHTCREARRALTEDQGGNRYELAFGTRSHGPRTWFCFGRDTLYLGERPWASHTEGHHTWAHMMWGHQPFEAPVPFAHAELLSGGWWDVGQFLSRDLRRVQRLVLGRCGAGGQHYDFHRVVGNLLPLVPNLEELGLEQWDQNAFDAWVRRTQMKEEYRKEGKEGMPPRVDERKSMNRRRDNRNRRRVAEPWRCFRAEEVDVIGPMYWSGGEPTNSARTSWQTYCINNRSSLTDSGPPGCLVEFAIEFLANGKEKLITHRYQPRLEFKESSRIPNTTSGSSRWPHPYAWPPGPSIFECVARQLEEELHRALSSSTPPETTPGTTSSMDVDDNNGVVGKDAHSCWNGPKITLVHVGSESAARWYCEGRHAFWRYFVAFQRAFARDKPFRPVTLGVVDGEEVPPLPPVPFFQIKWLTPPKYWGAIFREVDALSVQEMYNDDRNYDHWNAKLQAWCLTHLLLQEPSMELFF